MKVSVLVLLLYFNEMEQMVDLNLKDFLGPRKAPRLIFLWAAKALQTPPGKQEVPDVTLPMMLQGLL